MGTWTAQGVLPPPAPTVEVPRAKIYVESSEKSSGVSDGKEKKKFKGKDLLGAESNSGKRKSSQAGPCF